jgi:hypothetical protein
MAPARSPWIRRLTLTILGLELLSSAALAVRGFPYYGSDLVSNAPLWESPLAILHLPGIITLSLTGLCCGFHNSLVLGPRVVGGHIRMTPQGVVILAATNAALLLLLLAVGWGARRLRRTPAGPAPERPVSNSGGADRP